ncbi:GIY-YIG nuclease family protein [Oceanicaulis sp.]|uniref:GIY-YIG nuclease family protein n=1 Tax=Oceanicaulis sp. TaxID=1924941 RepID=UPI003D2E21BA
MDKRRRSKALDPGLRRERGRRGKWGERKFEIPYNANMVSPCVYLLASGRNGTLYCGSTGDLIKRVWEHRQGVGSRFTAKYAVHNLVWFEHHDVMDSAIQREHRIKRWKRVWKLRLIEEHNPTWADLYEGLV